MRLRDTVEEREKGAKGKEGGRDRRRDIDREGKTNRSGKFTGKKSLSSSQRESERVGSLARSAGKY